MTHRKKNTKTPIQERAKRQRYILLACARTTFHQLGYADTRISDIVRAAGVAHGTFYTYFDSREDVLMALASETYEILESSFTPPQKNSTIEAYFDANIPQYVKRFKENADIVSLVKQAASIHSEIRELHEQFCNHIVDIIEYNLNNKAKTTNNRVLAWMLHGALDGLLHAWLINKEAIIDNDTVLDTLQKLFAWSSSEHI